MDLAARRDQAHLNVGDDWLTRGRTTMDEGDDGGRGWETAVPSPPHPHFGSEERYPLLIASARLRA